VREKWPAVAGAALPIWKSPGNRRLRTGAYRSGAARGECVLLRAQATIAVSQRATSRPLSAGRPRPLRERNAPMAMCASCRVRVRARTCTRASEDPSRSGGERTKRLETRSSGGTHVRSRSRSPFTPTGRRLYRLAACGRRGKQRREDAKEDDGAGFVPPPTLRVRNCQRPRRGTFSSEMPTVRSSTLRLVLVGLRRCRCLGIIRVSLSLHLCLLLAPPALEQLRSLRAGISPL